MGAYAGALCIVIMVTSQVTRHIGSASQGLGLTSSLSHGQAPLQGLGPAQSTTCIDGTGQPGPQPPTFTDRPWPTRPLNFSLLVANSSLLLAGPDPSLCWAALPKFGLHEEVSIQFAAQ